MTPVVSDPVDRFRASEVEGDTAIPSRCAVERARVLAVLARWSRTSGGPASGGVQATRREALRG